ncbi:gliding motility-associated C-terminal domain-containing protein [Chryseobacterium sp. Tr-659]|uniref:T9SS type B sorting domain-containing protein n=1 Tax=Chryseobacterium sp. Tr-659 TaxID=2608340 RepID=UPI00141DC52D|nr:T9SS type B sorting domain-containing protein [Chryseobacterium sp. Tr-659]NIF06678.1 gliding motility-associated C-terminal domain-containing protein [Chryseobacterium sp. Tr-659]
MLKKYYVKKIIFLGVLLLQIFVFGQEDCTSAITICGNSNINYSPSGIGNVNENLGGCLGASGEHNSVWYKFTIATSGTLTFILTPNNPGADYDWAIYGPNASCGNLGSPIRCNSATIIGVGAVTGLNMTSNLTSVPNGQPFPFCRFLNVLAGETYFLYIDNWVNSFNTTTSPFSLTWGGTATFLSAFTNPNLAPNPFIAPGNAGPNANSPREISICGDSTTFDFSTLSTGILNGNVNFSVSYFKTANDATTGNNPVTAPIVVNTTDTYFYNINYNDPNNPNNTISSCKQTNAIIFKNKSLSASITSPSTTLCPGGSITLTSNNTTGNTWSTGETTQSIVVTVPGVYTLTSTNGLCTSAPASVTITQDIDPNVQIAGNTVLCESAVQLTASATGTGNSYIWSTGTAGNTIAVSTPGVYTVTVKTPANCQYTKSVTVTQGIVPVVQNSGLSQCSDTQTASFDLTLSQPDISTTGGVAFDYYAAQADALAGNANTIANPNAYISGNATIYVRVKSASCSKIAELQLTVTQLAAPAITSPSTTLCPGGSITLASNNATGNTWSTGETTQSIVVTVPGVYTLTSTNGVCTSAPASVTITQDIDPNVQIAGNTVLCESAVQLTASATGTGNTYTWSTGTAGNTIAVSTPGIYTVTVKTPANCQYTKSVTVTQGIVPVVQNSGLSQCSDTQTASFDLTLSQPDISTTGGVAFDYYAAQADALAGNANTIANPNAYISGNATIYVRVKSASCSKIAELQLTVTQLAAPAITSPSTILCPGGNITLTSNNATGNTWSTGETTQSIVVTAPGVYTLTSTNGVCTSAPASVTITQDIDPNVQILGNLTFCEGFSTTLTAVAQGSGSVFTWSNGINGPINMVNIPGIYTVTVVTPSGCQYQKSVTVLMEPDMVVNIAAPLEITCTHSQVTLDATASVYQPGASFSWVAANGGIIVSGADTLTPVVSNNGTYTLTITSASPSGCKKAGTVTVIKNTTPPMITVTSPKLKICKGESVMLTAAGADIYTWTNLAGNGNTQLVSPAVTTTYTVTGTGINGCMAQAPAAITIEVVPEITSILNDIEICNGDKGILDAGTGANYTYTWNTGANTQTIDVELAGTYTVTIHNGICSKTFSAAVNYIVVPEILNIVYKDDALTINVKNNGNTPVEYSIDGGITWQLSNTFLNVLKNTKYPVKVRNKGAICETETTYYTFIISNVITPNSDGKNDAIDFSEISKYRNFTGAVFDKYGKKVFEISSKAPVWNGQYLGRPLATDTYWYLLSWDDPVTHKKVEISGWVLVKNRD